MKRINIRQDLINKELERDTNAGYIYHKFNLHNSLISKLHNHYDCIEMCENLYDSEPDYDDEIHNMYMDYLKDQDCNFTFSEEPHTEEELKEAYYTILKQQEEYEPRRMEFCNWQEPWHKGNWGMSQEYVNCVAIEQLELLRKNMFGNKDRLYIAYKDDKIRIYWYGRDIDYVDYWFIFKRRDK